MEKSPSIGWRSLCPGCTGRGMARGLHVDQSRLGELYQTYCRRSIYNVHEARAAIDGGSDRRRQGQIKETSVLSLMQCTAPRWGMMRWQPGCEALIAAGTMASRPVRVDGLLPDDGSCNDGRQSGGGQRRNILYDRCNTTMAYPGAPVLFYATLGLPPTCAWDCCRRRAQKIIFWRRHQRALGHLATTALMGSLCHGRQKEPNWQTGIDVYPPSWRRELGDVSRYAAGRNGFPAQEPDLIPMPR